MIKINQKSEINIPKIVTKLELMSLYDKYKNTFDKNTLDYILSIINLEISPIKDVDGIDESDILYLNEYDIYKKAVIYNIYHKAFNTYKDDMHLKIVNDKLNSEFYVQNFGNTIFDFKYGSDIYNITILKYLNENRVEIKKIERKINDLESKYSLYKSHNMKKNMDICTRMIRELREYKDELSKQETGCINREKSKIVNKYFEIMKNEYGLRVPNEFHDEGKVLIKKTPTIIVSANVKQL